MTINSSKKKAEQEREVSKLKGEKNLAKKKIKEEKGSEKAKNKVVDIIVESETKEDNGLGDVVNAVNESKRVEEPKATTGSFRRGEY